MWRKCWTSNFVYQRSQKAWLTFLPAQIIFTYFFVVVRNGFNSPLVCNIICISKVNSYIECIQRTLVDERNGIICGLLKDTEIWEYDELFSLMIRTLYGVFVPLNIVYYKMYMHVNSFNTQIIRLFYITTTVWEIVVTICSLQT